MTDDVQESYDITEAMIRFGGSFARQLGQLYRVGDPVNQAKLRHTFQGLWLEYRQFVPRLWMAQRQPTSAVDLTAVDQTEHVSSSGRHVGENGRSPVTICIQCSLRALIAGETPPVFDETTEAHLARCHPDPLATYRERQMLEAELFKKRQIVLTEDDPDV